MTDQNDVEAEAAAKNKAAAEQVTKGAGKKARAAVAAEADAPAGEGAIEVRGPEGGRRRAGFRFTPTPLVIERSVITARQLAAIESDPLLTVKDVVVVAKEPPPA